MKLVLYLCIIYAYGSLAEWLVHKFLLHDKIGGDLYTDHSKHHNTYGRTFNEPRKGSRKGAKYQNLVLCLEHMLLLILPAALISLMVDPILSVMFLFFGVFHFYFYNTLHAASHLGQRIHFLPHWFVKLVIKNHWMHHRYANKLYCVSLPLVDNLLGTTCEMTAEDKEAWREFKKTKLKDSFADDYKEIEKKDNCLLSSHWFRNGHISKGFSGKLKDFLKNFVFNFIKTTQIGEITIINKELLENPDNFTRIYVFSHNSWKDIFLMSLVAPDSKVMAAQSVMSFCGLGFILGPLFNCFSAAPGKGIVVKSCIESLRSKGSSISICPSGWVDWGYGILPFKNGVERVISEANLVDLEVVSVNIAYGDYPNKEVFKYPFIAQVLISLFDRHSKSGCVITVKEVNKAKDLIDKPDFLQYLEESVK